MSDVYCMKCGAKLYPANPVCPQCGTSQYSQMFGGAAPQNMQGYGSPMPQNMQNYSVPNQQYMQPYMQGYGMANTPQKNHTAAIIAICATICVVVIGAAAAVVLGLRTRSSNESDQQYSVQNNNAFEENISSPNGENPLSGVQASSNDNDSDSLDVNPTITYELPDGFTEVTPGMYYGPNYPTDSSNIYIQSAENDAVGPYYTEEMFTDQLTTTYAYMGLEVSNLNFVEFTRSELDGYDSLYFYLTYTLDNVDIVQLEFIVQIENTTYALTYTTMPGSDCIALFQESINSVRIVR